jgi:hypothetical protein
MQECNNDSSILLDFFFCLQTNKKKEVLLDGVAIGVKIK